MRQGDRSDRFLELVRRLPLRPIRDDEALRAVSAMVDELLAIAHPSPDELEYLDVLGDLIIQYEDAAQPISEAPAADVLRYLMECRGLDRHGLAEVTGVPGSVLGDLLDVDRIPSQLDAARIAAFFHVPPDLLRPATPPPPGRTRLRRPRP